MKKSKVLVLCAILTILIIGIGYSILRIQDETYEGMSIIVEEHEDIPLFEGFNPTRASYVKEGNYLNEVYHYYVVNMPELGWTNESIQSELNSSHPGFYSYWTKKGFEGKLSILGSYDTSSNQTELIFDYKK